MRLFRDLMLSSSLFGLLVLVSAEEPVLEFKSVAKSGVLYERDGLRIQYEVETTGEKCSARDGSAVYNHYYILELVNETGKTLYFPNGGAVVNISNKSPTWFWESGCRLPVKAATRQSYPTYIKPGAEFRTEPIHINSLNEYAYPPVCSVGRWISQD